MITEALNPSAADIDLMSVKELIALMNKEDMVVVEAVKEAESAISLAIANAIDTIKMGGRLIYIGAGTSGRLGIIDASEIPPTFNDIDYPFLDGIIKLMVGPEIVAGSTRLKAGSATKMVLNMLSTITMIRLGRVYKGYMVDVVPSNKKLKGRALGVIERLTGCTLKEAEEAIDSSKGNVKIAVLMVLGNIGYKKARALLRHACGSLRVAIEGLKDEIGPNRASNFKLEQERTALKVFNSGTADISPKNFGRGGKNDKKA